MLNVIVDKSINRLKLYTDDPSVKCMLEFKQRENKYIPWIKKWRTVETITKIYEEKKPQPINGIWTFTIQLGWASYIANVFAPFISQEEYMNVIGAIMADSYPTTPFPNLRDYQNDDILHLLKYKLGLFTVYTGYGKQN